MVLEHLLNQGEIPTIHLPLGRTDPDETVLVKHPRFRAKSVGELLDHVLVHPVIGLEACDESDTGFQKPLHVLQGAISRIQDNVFRLQAEAGHFSTVLANVSESTMFPGTYLANNGIRSDFLQTNMALTSLLISPLWLFTAVMFSGPT